MVNESKVKNRIAWTAQIILAVLFTVAAAGKLISRPQWIEIFRKWGFPDRFYLLIGALEILGAVGLLIPRLAGYAACGLIILMIGAAATHLVNGEGLQVLRPVVFLLLLAIVVYVRRPWTFKQNE